MLKKWKIKKISDNPNSFQISKEETKTISKKDYLEMNSRNQQKINNSIDINQLVKEDHQLNGGTLRGITETIHTESYRSYAISTEFGKENLEFIEEIIEFNKD